MILALLDTDAVISMLCRDTRITGKIRASTAKSFAVSSVTLYELLVGVEKSADPTKNRSLLDDALAPFSIETFDESAGQEAAKSERPLRKKVLESAPTTQ